MRSFAASDRFVADVKSRKLAPGYVFVGDEAFFRSAAGKRFSSTLCRRMFASLSLYDMDLAEVDLREILDRARTPSLMAPFQVFFIRGVKSLYGRGKHEEEFAAIEDYFSNPNPDAHAGLCGRPHQHSCGRAPHGHDRQGALRAHSRDPGRVLPDVELARVEEGDAVKWAVEYGRCRRREARPRCGARAGGLARRRHDDDRQRTGEADAVRRREEAYHAGRRGDHGAGSQAAIVLRIDGCDLARAIANARWRCWTRYSATGDGEEAAIGHLYMLARTFRQMLVILERNVRDSRALWQALWQGFRMPPFAAEDVIRQARRYKSQARADECDPQVARADLALRSNPASKRLVLENLMLDLTAEPKLQEVGWLQDELPV